MNIFSLPLQDAIIEYFGTPKNQFYGIVGLGLGVCAGLYLWKTLK